MLRSLNVPPARGAAVVERVLRVASVLLFARVTSGDEVVLRVLGVVEVLRVVGVLVLLRVVGVELELRARRELFGAARVIVGTPLLVVRLGALR